MPKVLCDTGAILVNENKEIELNAESSTTTKAALLMTLISCFKELAYKWFRKIIYEFGCDPEAESIF